MATIKINFTKQKLENIPPPQKSSEKKGGVYDTYCDTKEKGLILLVSNGGAKTFYLYRKVAGRPERIKLVRFLIYLLNKLENTPRSIKARSPKAKILTRKEKTSGKRLHSRNFSIITWIDTARNKNDHGNMMNEK